MKHSAPCALCTASNSHQSIHALQVCAMMLACTWCLQVTPCMLYCMLIHSRGLARVRCCCCMLNISTVPGATCNHAEYSKMGLQQWHLGGAANNAWLLCAKEGTTIVIQHDKQACVTKHLQPASMPQLSPCCSGHIEQNFTGQSPPGQFS